MNKVFEGYLVLNWKRGTMKVLKRKGRLGPFDIPIRFSIELVLPEPEEHVISGKIEIPEEKVAQMVFEALKE